MTKKYKNFVTKEADIQKMISRSFGKLLTGSLSHRPAHRSVSSYSYLLQRNQNGKLQNEREYKPQQPPMSKERELAINKRMEMIERLKAVILGLLAIGGLFGGFELYQNRAKIKYFLFNEYDLSGFEKSYNDQMSNDKKKNKKLQEVFKPSNPNPSSVPGLYIVGNNDQNQLINDDGTKLITNFMRNSWFDDKLLKDVKIGENSSCAIDSKGNLIQWGNGYKKNDGGSALEPEYTLKGENLQQVELSNGVVYCLNSKGELIYIPESADLQQDFKFKKLMGLRTQNYQKINNGVKFQQLEGGKEHLLLLSKDKKVYVMATGLTPSKLSQGQYGLPQYSQFDKPPNPNELIELTNLNYFTDQASSNKSLRRRNFSSIASGDYHNLALDEFGSVWSWGVNTYGSLGHDINYNTEIIPIPKKIQVTKAYFKRNELPTCTSISAGGFSSFGTFKSSDIYNIFEDYIKKNNDVSTMNLATSKDNLLHLGWGKCLNGQLGIGHYIHCQSEPLKVKKLLDLQNYNETTQSLETINVKNWSVGSKHCIVTLDNNDVLAFGDNEFCQLGNGKKVKSPTPSNVPKLIEPESFKDNSSDVVKLGKGAKKYQEINNRLQLNQSDFVNVKGKKLSQNIEQKIYAGHEASAIYYSPI